MEKAWRVSVAPVEEVRQLLFEPPSFPPKHAWKTFPTPKGYRFLADPFPAPDGRGIFAEAFNEQRARGHIAHLRDDQTSIIASSGGHYSYPAPMREDGADYVVPEVSTWSAPTIFSFRESCLEPVARLDVPGEPRLLDPTLLQHGSHIYLFANDAAEGAGVLRLWFAPSLFSSFDAHPCSPVRVSPRGSRMAGQIFNDGARLIRFGQDGSGSYGDGTVLFDIKTLTPTEYAEVEIARIKFDGTNGPHTINFGEKQVVFDWYTERFSPFAGLRRLRERLVHSSQRRG
jgi:hypothetical protein